MSQSLSYKCQNRTALKETDGSQPRPDIEEEHEITGVIFPLETEWLCILLCPFQLNRDAQKEFESLTVSHIVLLLYNSSVVHEVPYLSKWFFTWITDVLLDMRKSIFSEYHLFWDVCNLDRTQLKSVPIDLQGS